MEQKSLDLAAKLLEGVELFNAKRFWDAHEAWEAIWLEERGEAREFIQALIQFAAAWHLLGLGRSAGANRLFERAAVRIDGFSSGYLGIELEALLEHASRRAEPPKLRLLSDWRGRLPSSWTGDRS